MITVIDISGGIGYGFNASDFKTELKDTKGDIEFHIASPGGLVYDGFEIYNAIRDYKRNNPDSKITAVIKGLAASMATYIASHEVFDEILAEDNAVYMIHNPITGTYGDYREMNKTANLLDNLAKTLSKAYHRKTGKDIDSIRKMMDDETWFFGEEIKEAGFVNDIIKTDNDKDKESALTNADLKVKALFSEMKKDESYNDSLFKSAAFLESEQMQDPEAPFTNEHAARLLDPNMEKIRVRRTSGSKEGTVQGKKIPTTIDIVWYIVRSGNDEVPRAQSLRFPITRWSESEAKKWLKDNEIKYILFEKASQSESHSDDNIPADGGTNLEEANMTLEELKKANPDLYAEIKQAGVEEEQKRVAEILAWKEKPEYKRHPAVLSKIDECIKNKCDRIESLTLINAVLTNGNIQASFESPDGISVGNGETGSGETAAKTNTTQEA